MKKEIITFKDPKSPISEVFRTLRTNIQFMNTKKLKSLLVTSTAPSEGKSWTTANLAVTFAQAGKKVILIDADMRKGRQFSIFGVSPVPGLSNYLSGISPNGEDGKADILSYIKETEVENLYLIPAGNIPPNPSELLVSEKMIEAINTLEQVCDLIIFDGTPSLFVTDSVIISRYVDSTIIVAAYKETKIDDLKRIEEDISNVGGKIAGIVVNKMPMSQKRYESSYYYGSTGQKLKSNKVDEQLKIERNKQMAKSKAKDLLKQNREENQTKSTVNTKKEQKMSNPDDLLKEMNEYIKKQREELKKGDK